MPSNKLIITDQAYNPIAGTVTYFDFSGVALGSELVPPGGKVLTSPLLASAWTVTVSSPGYYDLDAGGDGLRGEVEVSATLMKKPSFLVPAAVGVVIGYLLKTIIR